MKSADRGRSMIRSRVRSPGCALAAFVVLLFSTSALGAGHVAFLNFSDGTEAIRFTETDDAPTNGSQLCATDAVPPWGGDACRPSSPCRQIISDELQRIWRPFDVTFTTERPAAGDYTMVVIGPSSGSCRFGVEGLAPLDCGDEVPGNVALVFECRPSELARCATLISHELGHTYGLDHTDVPCDIMSGHASGCADQGFVDRAGAINSCGAVEQNSFRVLQERLGARPPDEMRDPPGGCHAAPGAPSPSACTVMGLLAAFTLRCRPLRRRRGGEGRVGCRTPDPPWRARRGPRGPHQC
jgi:hypothetical protein